MRICLVSAFPPKRRIRSEYGLPILRELPDRFPGETVITGERNYPASDRLPADSTPRCDFNSFTGTERLPDAACIQSTQYREREKIPELLMIELHGVRQNSHRKENGPLTRLRRPVRVPSRSVMFRAAAPRWVLWM